MRSFFLIILQKPDGDNPADSQYIWFYEWMLAPLNKPVNKKKADEVFRFRREDTVVHWQVLEREGGKSTLRS